jgi:hypothetical protein
MENQLLGAAIMGIRSELSGIYYVLGSYPHTARLTYWPCQEITDKNAGTSSTWHLHAIYVQNTMQHDAFEFLVQHIHFAGNNQWQKQLDPNYNLLFKVMYILKEVGSGICWVWQAGNDV